MDSESVLMRREISVPLRSRRLSRRKSVGQTGAGLAADGDGSSTIDDGDYAVWRAHFGQTAGSSASAGGSASGAVPEPTSRLMLIIGMLAVFFRRRAVAS